MKSPVDHDDAENPSIGGSSSTRPTIMAAICAIVWTPPSNGVQLPSPPAPLPHWGEGSRKFVFVPLLALIDQVFHLVRKAEFHEAMTSCRRRRAPPSRHVNSDGESSSCETETTIATSNRRRKAPPSRLAFAWSHNSALQKSIFSLAVFGTPENPW